MIDMLGNLCCAIWSVVGSLIGVAAIVILVVCIGAMIKGALE